MIQRRSGSTAIKRETRQTGKDVEAKAKPTRRAAATRPTLNNANMSHEAETTRGGNFTTAEDVLIARAYVRVTEDPIIGSEQKGGTFHDRVHAEYVVTKPSHIVHTRTSSSIQNRLKLISKQVRRFSTAYNTAKDCKPSGTSADDVIRIATGLFNGKPMKVATDDPGKPFQFFDAWEIMRKLPKFQAALKKDTETVASGSSSGPGEGEDEKVVKSEGFYRNATQDRAKGRKRAKVEKQEDVKKEKKLRLAASTMKLHEDQVRQMQNHNAMVAFTQGPGGASSEQAKEYFALVAEEALIAARERKAEREKENKDAAEKARSGLEVLFDTVGDVVDLCK